jgi:hypothetical protein
MVDYNQMCGIITTETGKAVYFQCFEAEKS